NEPRRYGIAGSLNRSQEVLLAINLSTCKVQQLTTTGSWNLLSVWDKYILATQGSTFEFHKLILQTVHL
ncbi:18514_t:CDS:2, partial [Gigaspora rosea]